jgi:hypothetical protein
MKQRMILLRSAVVGVITIVIGGAAAGGVAAQHTGQEEGLLRVQQQRIEATKSQDMAFLDLVLADELQYGHVRGAVDPKDRYMESVGSGRIRYLVIHPEGMEARVYGDVGVITGEVQETLAVGGGEPFEMRVRTIEVYVMRDGRWQMTDFQPTRFPSP